MDRSCHRHDGRPKLAYRRDQARRALKALRAEGIKQMGAYTCPVCGRIHLGHRPWWMRDE